MKASKPETINEFFDKKYGESGSQKRKDFEEKANNFFIAELVKEKRKEANMTQQQLAEKLNVKRTYISKIERAIGDIRISTLRKIIEQGLGGKLEINVKF